MKDDKEFEVKLNWQGHYNESSLSLTIPRALIKQNENKVQILMKFNPNVKNDKLKGIQGNWEEPKAYSNQKHIIGGMKYVQGAGTTAAAGTVLAKQMQKLTLAPKAAPVVARRASASPNRAIVAKNAPAAQVKKATLKPGAAKVPLKKTSSNSPNVKN